MNTRWKRALVSGIIAFILSVAGAETAATAPSSAMDPSSAKCRVQPLAGVYHPYRLHVVKSCVTVSGTVLAVRHEPDHDYHINLGLDKRYRNLINANNTRYEHGALVVEVIPMDQHDVPIPRVGQHITVTGSYVDDTDHGWMEIHPAWFINGHGSAAYTLSGAAASVQTGLCGNHDAGCLSSPSKSSTTGGSDQASSHGTANTSIVASALNVSPGDYASITIRTIPSIRATIVVEYESGPSHAAGLAPKTADKQGLITWSWKVGTRTTPGTWPVVVSVVGHPSLRVTLHVQ